MKNSYNFSKISMYLMLFSMFATIACKQPETNIITEPFTQEQAKITQEINEIFQAGKAKDFEKLEGFHLNSPKFTKYDNDSPLRQNYAQNTEYEKAVFSSVDNFNFKINELKVDVFGKVAVATFVMPYDAQIQGAKLIDTARATFVLIDDAGKWKITHEHFSSFKTPK